MGGRAILSPSPSQLLLKCHTHGGTGDGSYSGSTSTSALCSDPITSLCNHILNSLWHLILNLHHLPVQMQYMGGCGSYPLSISTSVKIPFMGGGVGVILFPSPFFVQMSFMSGGPLCQRRENQSVSTLCHQTTKGLQCCQQLQYDSMIFFQDCLLCNTTVLTE